MDSTRHCINFPSSDPKSLIQIQTFLNGEFSIVLDPQLTKTTIDLVIKYTDSTTLFLLQLLADALRRQHCNVHTLYVPYMPYMRQDRTTTNNHALSAKVVAQILDGFAATSIRLLHPHSSQLQGFFVTNVEHVDPTAYYADHILSSKKSSDQMCVVAPDAGAVKSCRLLADYVGADLVCVEKTRQAGKTSKSLQLWGDVKGKACVIYDDMIDGGGTIAGALNLLHDAGVGNVVIYITHGLFSGYAHTKFDTLYQQGRFEFLYVSDSLERHEQYSRKKILPIVDDVLCVG